MGPSGERILVVESDPDISDLVARQALKPLGYKITVVAEAASAIQRALQDPPDLIIANLALPGLSAQDLLTALTSQGIGAPLVVVAQKGQEQRVIQAFRLGAVDALFWPARDAEVVRVVERVLQQTGDARTRQKLGQQLDATHLELERRLSDLMTIVDIGRAVISVRDHRKLFDRILESARQLAGADISWLMVRDERTKAFLLAAHRNLPPAWARQLNQSLDDGISSLVALSGEPLVVHGAALEKFRVSTLGQSAAVVPLKVQNDVIGLLIVVRKADQEIDKTVQTLLEAVADFASISLLNARLFRAVEQASEAARTKDKNRHAMLDSLKETIREGTEVSSYPLEGLLSGQFGPLNREQVRALKTVRSALERLARAAEKTIPAEPVKLS